MALDYTYMFTGSSVFVYSEGKSWLVGKADSRYSKVVQLIKDQEPFAELKKVLEIDKREDLRNWCSEQLKGNNAGITIGETTVEIDGEPVYGALCRQILEMHNEEMPLDPLVNFVRKMRQNPSYRIREQLWGFIEACQDEGGFTLHNDGDIMAYKVVTEDFRDCHSRKFDNHPGCIVEMPREDVDDDPHHTCSAGLHFCAYSYVKSFGTNTTRLVLVKVNPKDVVSIPEDYGHAKARCCRYEVVEEIDAPIKKPIYNYDEDEDCIDECDYEERAGVYRDEWHNIHGESVYFAFKDPEFNGKIDFCVGDVVESWLNDYYDKDYHIGVLLEEDVDDEDLPWKMGFFDHDTGDWQEWWTHPDRMQYPDVDEAERESELWFVKLDEPKDADEGVFSSKYAVGDYVCIKDGSAKGIVVNVSKLSNGKIIYDVEWFEEGNCRHGFFEECLLDSCPKGCKDKDSTAEAIEDLHKMLKEMCAKAGIDYQSIRSFAENLADSVFDGKDNDDDGNAEFFVEAWLDDAGRKKTARFLESRCAGLMNGSLEARLALSAKEYQPMRIKRLIGNWMKEQLSDPDEDRVWKVLRTMMKSWDASGK